MKDLKSQFIDWLETKPGDERYPFYDTKRCACGQFAQALGWRPEEGDTRFRRMIETRFADTAFDGEHTFGALRSRLMAQS